MRDPNPKVDGGGFAKLEKAGIEVKDGVLEDECRWMNRGFIRRMTQGRPWVTLKIAASLDGKIALENGESKWITGPESRSMVHAMRAENDAVLTGIGTVLADDPQLTVRDAPGRTPLRVILDRRLRTPLDAKILEGGGVSIFALDSAPRAKGEALERAGARVEYLAEDNFLRAVLDKLCRDGVNYLMVEAGAGVAGAFVKAGLCDELALFTAPKIMGRGPSFARRRRLRFDGRRAGAENPRGFALRRRSARQRSVCMFTGLIETVGTVVTITPLGDVTELSIYAPAIAPELRHGDSVAISGACQTVTFMDANSFKVQMMPETLARTKLGGLRTGARVNLERAMRLDTRIDGHLVAGHVDGVAEVSKIEALKDTRKIYFSADERLLDGIVEKGSVTIDGVSLTVIDAEADFFSVGVIPTTLAETTLGACARATGST